MNFVSNYQPFSVVNSVNLHKPGIFLVDENFVSFGVLIAFVINFVDCWLSITLKQNNRLGVFKFFVDYFLVEFFNLAVLKKVIKLKFLTV